MRLNSRSRDPAKSLNLRTFDPSEVGWQHQVVVGKHSGRHAIESVLQEHGVVLSSSEMRSLLEAVRHAQRS